jgi:hypothetical protein
VACEGSWRKYQNAVTDEQCGLSWTGSNPFADDGGDTCDAEMKDLALHYAAGYLLDNI